MKFVVTGALGHIGSQWIRTAATSFAGAELVLIDDMSAQRYCSLFDLPTTARYQFIEGDIFDIELFPIFQGADVVLHFAAITDAAGSFGRRDEVERVNFEGTKVVAEACQQAGVPLLFPSTTSVYGTQASRVDEYCSVDELKPQSPYAEAKLQSENWLIEQSASGLRSAIVRFGTIFGNSPGMRFHTAVNKFCWQATMNQELTVWRTALNQKRPYLELGDACRVIDWFIRENRFDGVVTNAVTQNATVQDIIDAIKSFGFQPRVKFVDTAIMNQLSYEVGNSRLDSAGFRFAGELTQGVHETLSRLSQARSAFSAQIPSGIR